MYMLVGGVMLPVGDRMKRLFVAALVALAFLDVAGGRMMGGEDQCAGHTDCAVAGRMMI